MDLCRTCTARGNPAACANTPCNVHDSWVIVQTRTERDEAVSAGQLQRSLANASASRLDQCQRALTELLNAAGSKDPVRLERAMMHSRKLTKR